MSSESLFYVILGILILQFAIETLVDYLNARRFGANLPEEVSQLYDREAYAQSQAYKKANYRFGLWSSSFSLAVTLAFLASGGFGWVDAVALEVSPHPLLRALVFFGILMLGSELLGLPFSYYRTFVIEERFGFNKSSAALFVADKLKGWALAALLGGGMLAAILFFYEWAGPGFWAYAWGLIALFTVFINLFYSRLIVPLFNRQQPLEDGPLRERIQEYARKVGFELRQIFVIDGSRRSTKANAYFSGFGNQRRVTLYDTLIKDLNEQEVVAVLAHEVGHYKKKHTLAGTILSLLQVGLMLYILSLFIGIPDLSMALGADQGSFHAGVLAFGLLYSPLSLLLGMGMNFISRKNEYAADRYAGENFSPEPLQEALKKLSVNHLSNLTPHPVYVFFHYSHPPLLQRLEALDKIKTGQ